MIGNLSGDKRVRDEASAACMRDAMTTVGFSVGGLVDFTAAHGDSRPERSIHRMRNGNPNVSGEMRVLRTLPTRYPEIPR